MCISLSEGGKLWRGGEGNVANICKQKFPMIEGKNIYVGIKPTGNCQSIA